MPKEYDDDFIKISKKKLYQTVLVLILIAFGYLLNEIVRWGFVNTQTTKPEVCKKVCLLANLEYAYVKDGNCYCNQEQVFYDQTNNETVSIFQTVNAGIIKNITSEKGLTQKALEIIKRQQK